MSALKVVHLLDDFSFGGVTKALQLYLHPGFAGVADSRILPVDPSWSIAPVLEADIILTHFPPSWRFLPFLASLKLRNPRARFVHVEHSYTAAWEKLKVPNRTRFHALLRLVYRHYDAVIAVSHGQAGWLRAVSGLADGRLRVIQPWSGSQDLDRLVPVANPDGRRLVLGAYGRFAEAKGFETVIEAVKLLDPTRFTLLMGGFGLAEAGLKAAAGDHPNIAFAGRIEDVGGFLARCDVVVVPSRWEPFGQVAAEARLAARPIVVADVDGLPEHVENCGLAADCGSPQALADVLATLPELPLGEMARAGRESVRHGEAERIALWCDLFRELSGQRAARRSAMPRAPQPISVSAGQ